MDFAEHSPLAWAAFLVAMLAIVAFDMGVLHRRTQAVTPSAALATTAFYVALAMAFNAWIWTEFGSRKALDFLTGYFLEYTLSIDNLLVFIVIFSYFRVPEPSQSKVLMWGILGAILLRGIFIIGGLALIDRFDWIVIVFGAFLIYTGVRSMASETEPADTQNSRIIAVVRRLVPVSQHYHDEKFFTLDAAGKSVATPLFVVLIVMSLTDIIFAFDSVPAIFAITRDPYIVFTSNMFAILGLRSLFFAVSGLVDRFRYLKFGLSLVLIFIGIKMIYNYPDWLTDIPNEWALAITAGLILGAIAASVIHNRIDTRRQRVAQRP